MKDIFMKSRSTYGSPRLHRELLKKGYRIGKEKVAEFMRDSGLKAKAAKRIKASTTDSKHKFPIQENRLNQDFAATEPNTKWVGDLTFFDTAEGWLYLAAVLAMNSYDCWLGNV